MVYRSTLEDGSRRLMRHECAMPARENDHRKTQEKTRFQDLHNQTGLVVTGEILASSSGFPNGYLTGDAG